MIVALTSIFMWEKSEHRRDLFEYSYYLDKYEQLGSQADYKKAQLAKSKVPHYIVDEFVWRRERNFNVTMEILDDIESGVANFAYFYVSL